MGAMSERLRIGIVGAGGITRGRHVPGFRAIPGVELHGVVNRSPASTVAAAHELGIGTTYPDWHALVADPGIDAVVVATWPYLHAPVTIAALEAGKHVLTQARMAMDADEARPMLRASLAHPDLVAMVVPSPLSFWCDATIQRLLAEGTLGELRHMTVTWDTSGPAEAWRLQRRWSGHNVMALGIVYESIARWLGQAVAVAATGRLRAPIRQVPEGRITADVLDDLTLLVEFPGGLDSVWTMTTGLPSPEGNTVRLIGTSGSLLVDLPRQRLELALADASPQPVAIPADEASEWRVEAAFVGAIRGQEEVHLTDFETGVRYMAFTDAMHASLAAGCRVSIPESGRRA